MEEQPVSGSGVRLVSGVRRDRAERNGGDQKMAEAAGCQLGNNTFLSDD